MKKEIYGKLLFDKKTLTIIDCEKDATEIFIPAKIGGYSVLYIKNNAFEDCNSLNSIVFDEYFGYDDERILPLGEIGDYAFSCCTSLEEIKIPERIKTIGRGAFYGCSELKRVTFAKGAFVCGYAFANCKKLKSVTPVNTVCEGTFSYCESLTEFPVTDKVDDISEDAFQHCNSLVNINIPASVKRIEGLAFRGCARLKGVTFENCNGWYWSNRYKDEDVKIDVSDPERNASRLSRMDFDDGVICWYRK